MKLAGMKLAKELTTVTPVSRITAIIVLVGFIVVGFSLGIVYQETIEFTKKQTYTPPIVFRKPSPAVDEIANWISYDWKQITFKYPPNWSVEKIYYSTPSQHAKGESPENIGLRLFPGKEIKESNLIQIGGRQISCDPPQTYTKCSYIPLTSEYVYTSSKNPELLSIFDLLIKTIKK